MMQRSRPQAEVRSHSHSLKERGTENRDYHFSSFLEEVGQRCYNEHPFFREESGGPTFMQVAVWGGRGEETAAEQVVNSGWMGLVGAQGEYLILVEKPYILQTD